MANIDPHTLDVYLAYRRLTARSLGAFVSALAETADAGVETYIGGRGMGLASLPTLEVDAVRTGESIKYTFGEGWLPSVSVDKQHDIIINAGKMGLPILVGYLLLTAAKMTLETRNAYLDSKTKEVELVLKQTELGRLTESNEKTEMALREKAADAVNVIVNNPDYTIFEIYGVDITKCCRPSNRERPPE